MHKLRWTNLQYECSHLEFPTSKLSPFGRTTLPPLPLDSWTLKHRYSRWNYIAILHTSWDIRISSLHAAILNFPLPVSPCLVVRHCHYIGRIAGPQKHRYSSWNFVALYKWRYMFSSSEAAILDYPLPVASGNFTSISFGMGVHKNGGIAVELMSLSCIAGEILLGSFPPPH